MTEKRFNLRAGYYHNYTGICRNKEENLTTNEVVDLLNDKDKIIKEKEKLIRAKNQQLEDAKRILNKYKEYNSDLINQILNELGWD